MTLEERDFLLDDPAIALAFDIERPLPEQSGERTVRITREVHGEGYERHQLRGPSLRRRIRGIASSLEARSDDRVLRPMGCIATLPIPILFGHGEGKEKSDIDLHNMRIGELVLLVKTATHVVIDAVFDNTLAADRAWALIESGDVRCLSVGATDMELRGIVDGIKYYEKWRLREVSVCRQGRNPEARFHIAGNYSFDFY